MGTGDVSNKMHVGMFTLVLCFKTFDSVDVLIIPRVQTTIYAAQYTSIHNNFAARFLNEFKDNGRKKKKTYIVLHIKYIFTAIYRRYVPTHYIVS